MAVESRARFQSPLGGACCGASAEVSGEIQLCPGQSLIDNGLWQPSLRTALCLLDDSMIT